MSSGVLIIADASLPRELRQKRPRQARIGLVARMDGNVIWILSARVYAARVVRAELVAIQVALHALDHEHGGRGIVWNDNQHAVHASADPRVRWQPRANTKEADAASRLPRDVIPPWAIEHGLGVACGVDSLSATY